MYRQYVFMGGCVSFYCHCMKSNIYQIPPPLGTSQSYTVRGEIQNNLKRSGTKPIYLYISQRNTYRTAVITNDSMAVLKIILMKNLVSKIYNSRTNIGYIVAGLI